MSQNSQGSTPRPAHVRELNSKSGTSSFSDVNSILERAVKEAVFPGAVLLVSRRNEVLLARNVGKLEYPPSTTGDPDAGQSNGAGITGEEVPRRPPSDVKLDTVYDVGDLTAVAATIPTMMRLVQEGKVKLEDKIGRFVQGFGVFGKSPITIGHLLNHTSGLPGNVPFFEDLMKINAAERPGILGSKAARQYVINLIIRSELAYPVGTKQVFAESGLVLLGHLIEVLTGLNFERAVYRYITQPLGLKSSSFIDLAMIKRRGLQPIAEVIAPTELCPIRKRMLRGEVFDENSWAMGGIAGHAGLFSTVFDLQVLAATIIGTLNKSNEFIKRDIVELFVKGPGASNLGSYKFGWDSPSTENGMAGLGFSEAAVGMNSSTGCSMWLEPYEGLSVILLTNSVHPTRENRKILGFRQDIHRAVVKATR